MGEPLDRRRKLEQIGPAEPQDRQDRASRPDLQHRLERLPSGHPSSPYDADGARRPPPPDLRDFELPLSDEEPGADEETTGGRPDAPGEPDARPDDLRPNYWTEVPRFLRTWAEHVREWPERIAAAVNRAGDSEGSWKGRGNQYLNPERHAQAREVIGDIQRAEPAITDNVREVEYQNVHGGRLVGLEYRLKGDERLKEKIARELRVTPDAGPEEAARRINDAIRYTFCFDPDNYTDGYEDVKHGLEACGYEMFFSENHWNDAGYKGINTRWIATDGQRFEVQLHTPESFHAKQEVTHGAYERLRNPLTTYGEEMELHAFQREVSSWISVPDRAAEIPDFPKKGH